MSQHAAGTRKEVKKERTVERNGHFSFIKYAPRSRSSRSQWLKFLPAKSHCCYCTAVRLFLLFRARGQRTAASRPLVVKKKRKEKSLYIKKKKKQHKKITIKSVFFRVNCFSAAFSDITVILNIHWLAEQKIPWVIICHH